MNTGIFGKLYGQYKASEARGRATLQKADSLHPWLKNINTWTFPVIIEGFTIWIAFGIAFKGASDDLHFFGIAAGAALWGLSIGMLTVRQYVAEKLVEGVSQ